MINRIVTLEPSSTEIVFYVDGLNRLIGVSDKCNYPDDVKKLKRVVRTMIDTERLTSKEIDSLVKEYRRKGIKLFEIDWELIDTLSPDLIVGQGLCEVCAVTLTSPLLESKFRLPKNLKVYRYFEHSPRKFLDIGLNCLKLSKILGKETKGLELYEKFKDALNSISDIGLGYKVLFIEWLDPIYVGGLWVSDLLRVSGARTFLESGEFSRTIVPYDILKFKPDIVLISPCGFNISRTMKEIELVYKIIEISNPKVAYIIDSAYTANPSPRILDFVKVIKKVFKGEDINNEIAIRIV
jgi:iron complex transport system substrate-binding protein